MTYIFVCFRYNNELRLFLNSISSLFYVITSVNISPLFAKSFLNLIILVYIDSSGHLNSVKCNIVTI